jgi:hypothetical protein
MICEINPTLKKLKNNQLNFQTLVIGIPSTCHYNFNTDLLLNFSCSKPRLFVSGEATPN